MCCLFFSRRGFFIGLINLLDTYRRSFPLPQKIIEKPLSWKKNQWKTKWINRLSGLHSGYGPVSRWCLSHCLESSAPLWRQKKQHYCRAQTLLELRWTRGWKVGQRRGEFLLVCLQPSHFNRLPCCDCDSVQLLPSLIVPRVWIHSRGGLLMVDWCLAKRYFDVIWKFLFGL